MPAVSVDPKPVPSPAMVVAARNLTVDRVTAEVVSALGEAGVPAILLKGPSIARWLYPDGGRAYCDADLLVAPGALAHALGVVRSLGFEEVTKGFHPRELDMERRAQVTLFRRPGPGRTGGTVDLHRNLPWLPTPDDVLWTVFSSGAATLPVAGVEVRVPDRSVVALHVVVHGVQHAFDFHTNEDLRRALAGATFDDWCRAAAHARRLGILEVLGTGLRHHPEGRAIADRLGLPSLPAGDLRLWRASAPRGSLSLLQLVDAPTVRERAQVIRRELAPSPAKVRYLYASADTAGPALLRAYWRHWRGMATAIGPAVRFVLARSGRSGAARR